MRSEQEWSAGDTIVLRSVFDGHIRIAIPHTLVELTPERVGLHLPPGTRLKRFSGKPLHQVEDLETNDWSIADVEWRGTRRLVLTEFRACHSLDLFWDGETDEFLGWYVNLQEPLRRTRLGFDTRDQALDVVVDPDGSWAWKDEDHLAAAVGKGRFTPEEAAAIRAEAERVIARLPVLLPTGWEEWRPDPAWPLPRLPEGWDAPA